MAELLAPEDIELDQQEDVEISPSALAILNQSEHAAMVQTACLGNNRRKLAEFDSKLRSYANHSQPIALSMFYSLARAGKQIIGPSVRFAEIVAPCWKNCAVASRAIGDSSKTVTAQGIFIDYEANLRNAVEVPRRITDKDGRRYGDDMIVVTINAAMSVARRNAVLKGGVPQALWTPAYEDAQLTAVGKAASHAQRVADAMEYLHKLGVNEWQILNAVGVPSVRELETEHLLTLRVLCSEVRRGDKTIEQVFGSPHDTEINALMAQLKMNDAQIRMLRQSYMGRAEKLVEYLRERIGTPRSTPAAPPPAARPAPAPRPEPAPQVNQAAPFTGVLADIDRVVTNGMAEVHPSDAHVAEVEQSREEWDERDREREAQFHPEQEVPPPVMNPLAGFDFGANATSQPREDREEEKAFQQAGIQSMAREEQQVKRGRGRPPKEPPQRAAISPEAIVEAREDTAEQARQQAEQVLDQIDQFAF